MRMVRKTVTYVDVGGVLSLDKEGPPCYCLVCAPWRMYCLRPS